MHDHPETPPAAPSPDDPAVTLRESAYSTLANLADLADLADLARSLPGDAARNALAADRLAEEMAEAAAMLRALPGRAAAMSGHDYALLMALRTARAAGEDVAETIARVLARLAAELGGTGAVLSNRPGSWEAGHIRGLLAGTAGEAGEALPFYGGAGGSL